MVWFALAIAVVLFLLGIVFTIYPILPGAVFAFAGVIVYAWITGSHTLPKWVYILSALMVLANFAIDSLASTLGVKKAGGSKQAMIGAAVGTMVLPFLVGPILGVILGPVIGAIIGELLHVRNAGHLAKVGFASLLGFLTGTVLKLITVFVMIGGFFIGRH
jgi:uncharacterized protein YqgC (DUF456 family)